MIQSFAALSGSSAAAFPSLSLFGKSALSLPNVVFSGQSYEDCMEAAADY
jgi:hypothetical protein